MRRRIFAPGFVLLIMLLVLAGCAPSAPAVPTQVSTQNMNPTATQSTTNPPATQNASGGTTTPPTAIAEKPATPTAAAAAPSATNTPEAATTAPTAASTPTTQASPTAGNPTVTGTVEPSGTEMVTAQTLTVEGAAATAVAVDSNGTVYAVTNRGLYRNPNPPSGTWTKMSSEVNLPNLVAEGNLLLSGKAVGCSKGDPGVPLRISTDGGKTWSQPVKFNGEVVEARPVQTFGTRLHAIACTMVYYSDDQGKTWKRTIDLTDSYDIFDLATDRNAQVLYYTATSEGGSGILRKASRTSTGWANPQDLLSYWGAGTVSLSSGGTIYVGTAQGVQYSTDGGKTWHDQNKGLEAAILGFDPSSGSPPNAAEEAKFQAGARVYCFGFSWDGGRIYLGSGNGLYMRDSTSRWQLKALQGQKVLEITAAPKTLYVRTDRGVMTIPL